MSALASSRDRWATLPVELKIRHLQRIAAATVSVAEEWVAASVRAKGTQATPGLAGEEWMTGPWVLLRSVRQLQERLALKGQLGPALPVRRTGSGQWAVQVFPRRFPERLLMHGIRAEVWLQPGAEPAAMAAHHNTSQPQQLSQTEPGTLATQAPQPKPPAGRLQLVLGAGNVSSIAPLDALYKLYNECSVVVLKLNPVTEYLTPILRRVFASLIEDGFLAVVTGGADLGALLSRHPLVDAIHITGSAATQDRIVFGDSRGNSRKRINHKPITSELGGVSPVIVVPGPWTRADLRFQAQHIATQRLHNGGFNCIASQIAVLPHAWQQTPLLVEEIRRAFKAAPSRPAYYPGASERIRKFSHSCGQQPDPGQPDRLVVEVPPDSSGAQSLVFTEEAFCSVLGITQLSGADPQAYLERAIEFCNKNLSGTLGASILIHPATLDQLGSRFDLMLARMRYGCVGVNLWQGAGYFLTEMPWGAYPGHAIDDIQSGIGVVHNTLMLEQTEKSVVSGPFHPFPRSLLHGFSLLPLPPWFVSHRAAHHVGRLLFDFEAHRSVLTLLRIAWHAIRSR